MHKTTLTIASAPAAAAAAAVVWFAHFPPEIQASASVTRGEPVPIPALSTGPDGPMPDKTVPLRPPPVVVMVPAPKLDATPDLPPARPVTLPIAPPPLRIVHVQVGHSLWKLARDAYGTGKDYVLILEANRASISNPNLIRIGQDLILPPKKEH
jgi:nucleoid-associated protein YgaU